MKLLNPKAVCFFDIKIISILKTSKFTVNHKSVWGMLRKTSLEISKNTSPLRLNLKFYHKYTPIHVVCYRCVDVCTYFMRKRASACGSVIVNAFMLFHSHWKDGVPRIRGQWNVLYNSQHICMFFNYKYQFMLIWNVGRHWFVYGNDDETITDTKWISCRTLLRTCMPSIFYIAHSPLLSLSLFKNTCTNTFSLYLHTHKHMHVINATKAEYLISKTHNFTVEICMLNAFAVQM